MRPGERRFKRLFRGQGLRVGQKFGHGIRRIDDLRLRRYHNQVNIEINSVKSAPIIAPITIFIKSSFCLEKKLVRLWYRIKLNDEKQPILKANDNVGIPKRRIISNTLTQSFGAKTLCKSDGMQMKKIKIKAELIIPTVKLKILLKIERLLSNMSLILSYAYKEFLSEIEQESHIDLSSK